MWTTQLVKQHLPTINVKVGHNTISGKVTGRDLAFAVVVFSSHGRTYQVEAAWDTVVRCLNKGRPLITE